MVSREDWTHAQRSVIGSALIDEGCVGLIMSELRREDLTGEFQTLYDAIVDLKLRGQPVDPVVVLNKVGPAYEQMIRDAMIETPTAANAAAYVKICKEQSRLSRLSALGVELSGALSLDDARRILQEAQGAAVERSADVTDMQAALAGFYERHQQAKSGGVTLGIKELDERVMLDFGDVFVLGGYPSDGKTALMLQWCWHLAQSYPVGIFSFETSAEKLMDRIVTQAVPKLSFTALKHGELEPDDWKRITAESVHITKRNLRIVEAAGMTAADILGVTLSRGFKVIALDYVQLIAPGTVRRGGTRQEELAEISKALALMARRHKLLVLELSQLVRPQKGKDGKIPAPTIASLRESGQLEQDADVIALLYRERETDRNFRQLYVAKYKDGELGRMTLRFEGDRQRFGYQKLPNIPRELEVEARKWRDREREGPPEQIQIEEVKQ